MHVSGIESDVALTRVRQVIWLLINTKRHISWKDWSSSSSAERSVVTSLEGCSRTLSLGTLGNSIAGIIGGGLGGQILSMLGVGGAEAAGSPDPHQRRRRRRRRRCAVSRRRYG